MRPIQEMLSITPVMPVIVINQVKDSLPLADALLAGGIAAIEVTLRTDAALGAIAQIAQHRPQMTVGAGTVIDHATANAASEAGAQFVVSPGATPTILHACAEQNMPLLAGAQTVSEMLALRDLGHHYAKFFPANTAGGIDYIKSLQGPLADMYFCPTGGINLASAPDWLDLSNVICVGGSWVASVKAIDQGDFEGISERAAETISLKK